MNGIKLKIAVTTAILTLAAVGSMQCTAIAQLEIVAISGNPSPDGNGTFLSFGTPVLARGGLAFTATLTGTTLGQNDNRGIYRYRPGEPLTRIARKGQAPVDGNGTFFDFNVPAIAVGGVTFVASLAGTSGGLNDNLGYFRGNGGAVTPIVRKGQPTPDGNGVFLSIPSLASNGKLQDAFDAQFTQQGQPQRRGVFTAFDGTLTEIARSGQTAPGGGIFTDFGGPSLSPFGEAAFRAFTTTTPGIFRGGEFSALAQIARGGQPAPDGNGVFGDFGVLASSAVRVAFYASLTGTSGGGSDDSGIFLGDGVGPLGQIVREGQSAPVDGVFSDFGALAVDFGAGVAFQAFLRETSGGITDNEGLFIGFRGGPITQIVRKGQPAPDGNGTFFAFTPQQMALDYDGRENLAFWAQVNGTSGGLFDNEGIFLAKASGEILQIARKGDPLDNGFISALEFAGSVGASGDARSGLFSSGRALAFRATLDNGRQAILRFTVPLDSIAGDFNEDGVVDAADFVVLRKDSDALPADAYDVWRANFGQSQRGAGAGAVAHSASGPAVPEPASILLWLCASGLLYPWRLP